MTSYNNGEGLPRLIRRVDPGTLPGTDLLAILDPSINLLIIDRVKFAKLTKQEQELVYRTNETALVLTPHGVYPARLLDPTH